MLNNKILKINKSSTLAIVEKAKELKNKGIDVITLSVGEPDFSTPEYIKEAGKKAIDDGKTKYTAASGIKELKEALIEKYKEEQDFEFSRKEIIIHPGSKFSIYLTANVLLNEGERVLIPSPYWVSYPEIIKAAGGEPVFVRYWDKNNGFEYSYDKFLPEIKKGIKLFILSSPSNPTGAIMKSEELKKLLHASLEYDFYLLIDECYRRLIFDSLEYPSPLKILPEAKDKVLVSGSFSKTYAMTGWRIGWTFANSQIIDYMGRLQSHSTSNPPTMSQYAALAAITKEKDEVVKMVIEYKKRRDIGYELLKKIKGISIQKPEGAFYLFPNIKEAINGKYKNTFQFAEQLLSKYHVAVVPGEAFGEEGFIRISYAASEKHIREGIGKIKQALNG
jgi:aspartate aminotransferase